MTIFSIIAGSPNALLLPDNSGCKKRRLPIMRRIKDISNIRSTTMVAKEEEKEIFSLFPSKKALINSPSLAGSIFAINPIITGEKSL
jgi:hypothetical protein